MTILFRPKLNRELSPAMRPLEGIFVLDFSTLLPGPMATLLLAEAGAEVVKIERPDTGEDMRAYAPRWGADSINFALLNRGKKSVALDLKDPAQRARLDPLIARADVIVEQFRPGVMARLGLDYENVSKINSRIIYCSITGYGRDGPKRDVAGHDLNYIGDAGLLALSMGGGEKPVVPPALIADIAGGAYPAVMNILLALTERARTGKGRYLDVAMTDNLFPFMFWALGEGMATGTWPRGGESLLTGGTACYRLYPTRDGQVLAVAAIEQKFWDNFCAIIALEPHFAADRYSPASAARVAEIVRAQDGAFWEERFQGQDCCCSIVKSAQQAMADPHFAARGLFAHTLVNAQGATIPALPVPVDSAFRGPAQAAVAAPALGAHNADYLE
ncbi:MAG TPA: CaiB/BaiF CoA-transferase family protein [Pseudolabrys sp.]|nr:CaiB/BaiF CoA-transferase family protein [Pseudolabrys sp.]